MYVYLMLSEETGLHKIGYSKNPEKRLKQLETGAGKLTLIEKFKTEYHSKIESTLHRNYSSMKRFGEWFELSMKDVSKFKEKCLLLEDNLKYLEKKGNIFI